MFIANMGVTKGTIKKNLNRIAGDIGEACAKTGRFPDEVRIIAVTKSVGLDEIKALIDCGVTDLGESRASQLKTRSEELAAVLARRRSAPQPDVQWHMIGHLQRNKSAAVISAGAIIHSVDTLRLAEEISTRAQRLEQTVDVLLQVNCSKEAQKFGAPMGAAVHLGEIMAQMKNLRLVGLMTMASRTDDPQQARSAFTRLRELFEEMQSAKTGGEAFRHLSMGMSQDYAVAVEEGATLLRIGTAIFQ